MKLTFGYRFLKATSLNKSILFNNTVFPNSQTIFFEKLVKKETATQMFTCTSFRCDIKDTCHLFNLLSAASKEKHLLEIIKDKPILITKRPISVNSSLNTYPLLIFEDHQFTYIENNKKSTLSFVDLTFSEISERLLYLVKIERGLINELSQKDNYEIKETDEFELIRKFWNSKNETNNKNMISQIYDFSKFTKYIFSEKMQMDDAHFYFKPFETSFRSRFYKETIPKKKIRTDFAVKMNESDHLFLCVSILSLFFEQIGKKFTNKSCKILIDEKIIEEVKLLLLVSKYSGNLNENFQFLEEGEIFEEVSVDQFLGNRKRFVYEKLFDKF